SVVKDFNLPESVVQKRESLESFVINNYENENFESVKQAVCDLLLHTSSNVAISKITTLRERAETCEEFNSVYGQYAEFFDKMVWFLSQKGDFASQEVCEMLEEIYQYKNVFNVNGKQVCDIIEELYEKAETAFVSDLSQATKESGGKIFEGLEPEEIALSGDEKVDFYKVQNQTDNQRSFQILSRSTSVFPYMTQDGAKEKYQEEVSKFDYYSYSLFDESHLKSFSGKHRIRFGFFDVPKIQTEIVSCSVYDGQTNQFLIERGKPVVWQQLMSLNDFMSQTGSYNEIVLTNPEMILPSVLITSSETPSEEEIKVAKAFNIPLVFIDGSSYKRNENKGKNQQFITYDSLLKTPLREPNSEPTL
ncbi:MAG: hypothetical protein IJD48_02890, partial [Clostridia bacterium]|nr:hypothetical protein [Clostridia bacterium]